MLKNGILGWQVGVQKEANMKNVMDGLSLNYKNTLQIIGK